MSKKKLKVAAPVAAVSPVEDKPQRTLEQITADYSQVCTKAGDLQYRIKIMQGELEVCNKSLYDLNQEAAKLKETK